MIATGHLWSNSQCDPSSTPPSPRCASLLRTGGEFARPARKGHGMTRREFIKIIVGSASVWPLGARAQQPERMQRVLVLMGIADDADAQARATALHEGLQPLGWRRGRNIQLDYRFADGDVQRMRLYAQEAIASGSDLILAQSNP